MPGRTAARDVVGAGAGAVAEAARDVAAGVGAAEVRAAADVDAGVAVSSFGASEPDRVEADSDDPEASSPRGSRSDGEPESSRLGVLRLICGPRSVSDGRRDGIAEATAATTAIRAMRTTRPTPMALLVNMAPSCSAVMRP